MHYVINKDSEILQNLKYSNILKQYFCMSFHCYEDSWQGYDTMQVIQSNILPPSPEPII